MLDHTIAAIATPIGEGGLAVIRISGAQALAVAKTQDAAGMAVALQGLKVTEGASPPFTLGVSGLKLLPFPRVPRSTVQAQLIKGGQVLALKDGQFIDIDNPSVPVTSG